MQPSEPISNELPQYPESLWRATTDLPSFPRLTEDIKVDVAIVGAGIAGITTGYLLAREGLKVALVEAGNVLNGTTAHTTAKITAQHGMLYDELLSHFGQERASMYYQANRDALQFIRDTASKLNIDCGLHEEDAYVYMEKDKDLNKLEKEFEAYEKLGIPGEWVNKLPIPQFASGAIKMPGQARFHPLHYLRRLLEEFVKAGGQVYENTTVHKVDKEGPLTVVTYRGSHKIQCSHVVAATHFPFLDEGGFYFARLHADRSYALAMKPETAFAGGMYISADKPTRSLRAASWNGEEVVIVGGEGHKTGQHMCTFSYYEALEAYGGKLLGSKGIPFRWSTQDLVTIDKVPYIGQITSKDEGIYVATGFNKWGMTSGTLAGRMLSDQIIGRDNPYSELYTPSRFLADPSIMNLVKENADVAGELISGKVGLVHTRIEDLNPDEGAVVRHNGKKAGAYKDPEGNLHLVDNTCTHMGCETEWNAAERTWDCPCHGSRFSYDGVVFEGPAIKPLEKLDAHE